MNELVSIIIPMYNCSTYIEQAINSCLQQTYNNIEIVCIDDGSTDDSYEIAKTVLAKSDRRYNLLHKENGGVASARNVGLKEAKGTFVSFLDGDDVLSPYAIDILMKTVALERADAVVGDFVYSEDCFWFDKNVNPVIRGREDLMSRIVVWGGVYRKDVLPSFDEQFKTDEDVIFMINLNKKIDKAIHLDNIIYGYRKNHGSLTSKRWRSLGRVYDCIKVSEKIQDMVLNEPDIVFRAKLINRFRTSKNSIYGELKACGEINKDVNRQVNELRLDWKTVSTAKLSLCDKTREWILLLLPFLDSYTTFKIIDKIRN